MTQFGGMDQEEFLSRIRSRRTAVPLTPHPGSLPYGQKPEEGYTLGEKVQAFTRSLEALGGMVHRAPSPAAAYERVEALLKERAVTHALLGPELEELAVRLRGSGIQGDLWETISLTHGSDARAQQHVDRWGAGVEWVDFAACDLGSVALLTSEGSARSVSLLPPVYIALVSVEALRFHRRTVMQEVAARRSPGRPLGLTFITGPSRSGDIEMDLSIGVHGPGEVVAILVGVDHEG